MKIQILYFILSLYLQSYSCMKGRGISNDVFPRRQRQQINVNFRDDLNPKLNKKNQVENLIISDILKTPTETPKRDNDVIPTISQMCTVSSSIKSKFSLGKKLGKGAFGEVRDVQGWAIKQILSKGGLADRKALSKEIFHLKKLKSKHNPNLPYLVDCYTEKNGGSNPVYIQQQKLYSNIDFKPSKSKGYLFLQNFKFEKRVQIWIEWLKALQDIHQKGYVHLDIKPDNVMTTADFDVIDQDKFHLVFIDFGLMKKIRDYYEIGHTVYFHPSVHKTRTDVAVVPAFDIYQACLTIFVVENYKYDTIRRSGSRDSENLFPMSRLSAQQFSEFFRGTKQNIWTRFKIQEKRKDVSSIRDCQDFFCVISYGIQGDVNKIPSLSSIISKLESLYPAPIKEQFDIETVVAKESRKQAARDQILQYAKKLKDIQKQDEQVKNNQEQVHHNHKENNPVVDNEQPIQKKAGVFKVKKSLYDNDLNQKLQPVKPIHFDQMRPGIKENLKAKLADIDKLAVPSQSNEQKMRQKLNESQQQKPRIQMQVRKPSDALNNNKFKQRIPSNNVRRVEDLNIKKDFNRFKVFI